MDMPEIKHAAPGMCPPFAAPSTTHKDALFGKYEVGKLLGCGAFAKVYHARDLSNGQSVAIKIINKSKIANNATLMSNIKREISIMRRMNHPYIVKLYEVLATKSKIYFVMEFVKGGELFKKVASRGRMNEDLCRKYFQQLISALSYCHSRGVYHRDLKPENLLLDENGDLKVSDFGLSAVTDQVHQDGLLHTLCGTPAYVAPEILSKKGYDGAKIDIWSCGVILYVLSAGYLPFNDPNLMVMYKKIYKGEFRCPKWMSPELKRFLSRLLVTNPTKRITMAEINNNPWFNKGVMDMTMLYDDDVPRFDEINVTNKPDEHVSSSLNAFDLISFSSGLDLSALFNEACVSVDYSERLVVEKSPERIVEKVEEMIKEEGNVRLKKTKEWGVELQGQNGQFVISLEIYQLTDDLAVVEVKRVAGGALYFNGLWKKKIKPEILCP